jgi:hypothetical protein
MFERERLNEAKVACGSHRKHLAMHVRQSRLERRDNSKDKALVQQGTQRARYKTEQNKGNLYLISACYNEIRKGTRAVHTLLLYDMMRTKLWIRPWGGTHTAIVSTISPANLRRHAQSTLRDAPA